MKFVVAVSGSRGDAQPAVALAGELGARGHTVTLAVPPDLTDFCSGAGTSVVPYGGSTRAVLESDLVRSDLKSRDPRRRLRAISEITVQGGRQMQHELLDLTTDADAIIATSAGQERAHNVAEARGIPHIPMHYCPIRANRSVSMLAHLGVGVPGVVHRASWTALEQILWRSSRGAEDTLRSELDLPPLRTPYASAIAATGSPEIQAYDCALFSALAAEWGPGRPLVGFLNLSPQQRGGVGDRGLDDGLAAWLDAGPPPVYVGFGSMMPKDPVDLARALRTAAATSGVRLLVSGGWSGFMAGEHDNVADADESIRVVGHVDHDTILPRCRAAIHHGGAGSVAAGLRAGLPTLVTWFGADQPIWGHAITTAHLGTSFPISRLTPDRLTDALRILTDDTVVAEAASMRTRLTSPQQAVSRAADIVEQTTARSSGQNPI